MSALLHQRQVGAAERSGQVDVSRQLFYADSRPSSTIRSDNRRYRKLQADTPLHWRKSTHRDATKEHKPNKINKIPNGRKFHSLRSHLSRHGVRTGDRSAHRRYKVGRNAITNPMAHATPPMRNWAATVSISRIASIYAPAQRVITGLITTYDFAPSLVQI
jgi:hypothetical protein